MGSEFVGSVGLVVGVIVLGVWLYRLGRGAATSIPTVPVSKNNAEATCTEACKQFNTSREDRCSAKFAEEAAKTAMEAARTDYWATVGALTAMVAAAVAAMAGLPWPANLIVSLVLWTAATVLTGVMIYMLGRLNAATDIWTSASTVLLDSNTKVMEARPIVNSSCPPEAAETCLNTPDPC